jgi:hypothetical protein
MLSVYPHTGTLIFQVWEIKAGRKVFATEDDLQTIKKDYAEFALLGQPTGTYSTGENTHGASTAPKLQILALKLLSQPASSSCFEKNWIISVYICSTSNLPGIGWVVLL